jgi:uncharacterized protein
MAREQRDKGESQSTIDSPCIRCCTLDERDICVGCFRTLNEILAWNKSSIADKTEILERAKRRSQA